MLKGYVGLDGEESSLIQSRLTLDGGHTSPLKNDGQSVILTSPR